MPTTKPCALVRSVLSRSRSWSCTGRRRVLVSVLVAAECSSGSRSRTSRREAMTGSNGLDRSTKCAPEGDPECSLEKRNPPNTASVEPSPAQGGARSFQVTPDIPDRRRATQQKEVRPPAGRQRQRESARRWSGPSPQRRTSPTKRDHNSQPHSKSWQYKVATVLRRVDEGPTRAGAFAFLGAQRTRRLGYSGTLLPPWHVSPGLNVFGVAPKKFSITPRRTSCP
jgi:hypothetical protein